MNSYGVARPTYQIDAVTVRNMAQPHKGPRRQVMVRADVDVYDRMLALVEAGRASSVSQAAADLLAIVTQLPDRARELTEPAQLGLWDTKETPLKTA